jgi:hypothetical protein
MPLWMLSKNVSTRHKGLDSAFERLLASTKLDPRLAHLHLMGWYCVRGAGDTTPLLDSDIEFHNRRFRRATDIALILKPQQDAAILIELYSKSVNAAISRQLYRSGSLYLETKLLGNEPIEVTMRATTNDDYS